MDNLLVTWDAAMIERQDETIFLAEWEPGTRKYGHGHVVPRPRQARTANPLQRYKVEKARWATLEDSFRRTIQHHLRDLDNELIRERVFVERFSRDLYEFQVRVYTQGKRVVGDYSNTLSSEERRWLHGQHSKQLRFFHNFVRTMRRGGGRMPYDQRLDLYGLSGYPIFIRGSINSLSDSDDLLWLWKTRPTAEHCPDCIRRQFESQQAGGWPTAKLLELGLPGEWRTRCGSRCACSVVTTRPEKLNRTRPTTLRHVQALADWR